MEDGRRGIGRRIRRAVRVLVIMAVAVLGIAWIAGSRLVAPCPSTIGPPPEDLDAETVRVPSESGSLLSGWYAPVADARGAVLLLHGIRASRLQMLEQARLLVGEGYSVLLIDFQGHGESPGEHITVGHRERHDVLAALAFLRRREPGLPVAAVGRSMGGAAALLARPELDALVLESVYPTIVEAVENRVRQRIGPLTPIASTLLMVQLRIRLGITAKDLRPIEALAEIDCPVLIMSGGADRSTTPGETRRMFERVHGPKELVIFEGAGHVGFYGHAPEEYRRHLLAFMAEHLGDSPSTVSTSGVNEDVRPTGPSEGRSG